MQSKPTRSWKEFRLETSKSERISKNLVTIIIITIALLVAAFFGLGTYLNLSLSDRINFFLSSTIALFAVVEGLSTYLQANMEKETNRLSELKEELEKAYAPLYSIFSANWTHVHEKEIIITNETDKNKIDSIFRSYPYLIEPLLLKIWRAEIERLEPQRTKETIFFVIPAYFVSHITIEYDNLTDEYHKRVGRKMQGQSSFWQRLHRHPPNNKEKTIAQIIGEETKTEKQENSK